jgi:hypothetical protein
MIEWLNRKINHRGVFVRFARKVFKINGLHPNVRKMAPIQKSRCLIMRVILPIMARFE